MMKNEKNQTDFELNVNHTRNGKRTEGLSYCKKPITHKPTNTHLTQKV